MDMRGFGRRAEVIADGIEDNANKLKRKVALAVDAAVVLATPVDTGRARSNWIVELNAPSSQTIEPLAGVRHGHAGSGGAVARASIEAAKGEIEKAQPGDMIHITNNLHYISALNDGTSAQAPANFVEEAVLAGVERIKGATLIVDSRSGRRIFNDGPRG